MKHVTCSCGSAVAYGYDERTRCASSGRATNRCPLRPTHQSIENAALDELTEEQLDQFEEVIHDYQSTASDVIDIAREFEIPKGYLIQSLRGIDEQWADDAIEEIVQEACGYDPRLDSEFRRDQPALSTWGTKHGATSSGAQETTMAAADSVNPKSNPKQPVKVDPEEADRNQARAQGQGDRPDLLGVELYNEMAGIMAEKLNRDVEQGFLKRGDPASEAVIWQAIQIINLQEQLIGQLGFFERVLFGKGGAQRLAAKLLGGPVSGNAKARKSSPL